MTEKTEMVKRLDDEMEIYGITLLILKKHYKLSPDPYMYIENLISDAMEMMQYADNEQMKKSIYQHLNCAKYLIQNMKELWVIWGEPVNNP